MLISLEKLRGVKMVMVIIRRTLLILLKAKQTNVGKKEHELFMSEFFVVLMQKIRKKNYKVDCKRIV